MSCHVMSCHVMSCHVMSCHVRPSQVSASFMHLNKNTLKHNLHGTKVGLHSRSVYIFCLTGEKEQVYQQELDKGVTIGL